MGEKKKDSNIHNNQANQTAFADCLHELSKLAEN